jgi:Flp pilus assembly pilin Flp
MDRGVRGSVSGHVGWCSTLLTDRKSLLLLENTMKSIGKLIGRLFSEETGTETLEWGLVAGLIVVGAIVAITAIGPKVKTMWTNTNTAIP